MRTEYTFLAGKLYFLYLIHENDLNRQRPPERQIHIFPMKNQYFHAAIKRHGTTIKRQGRNLEAPAREVLQKLIFKLLKTQNCQYSLGKNTTTKNTICRS